jgi:hypothetical protein
VLGAEPTADADAARGYALRLEPDSDGTVRRLHLCFEGNRLVGRGREPAPVVGTLLGHLGSLAALDDDTLLVDVTAYVRDDVAVLGPAALRTATPVVDRAARGAGLRSVAAPGALVGLDDGCLVVAEPLDGADLGAAPPPVPAGRYPIAGWLLPGPDVEPVSVPTADALRAVRSLVHGANLVAADRALFALAAHLGGVALVRGPGQGSAAIRLLDALCGQWPSATS